MPQQPFDYRIERVRIPDFAGLKRKARAEQQAIELKDMTIADLGRRMGEAQAVREAKAAGWENRTVPQQPMELKLSGPAGESVLKAPMPAVRAQGFNRDKAVATLGQSQYGYLAPDMARQFQHEDGDEQMRQLKIKEQVLKMDEGRRKQVGAVMEDLGRKALWFKSLPPELREQAYEIMLPSLRAVNGMTELPDAYTPETAKTIDAMAEQAIAGTKTVKEWLKEAAADKRAATKTVRTGKGIMQFDPVSGGYNKLVGPLPLPKGKPLPKAKVAKLPLSQAAIDKMAELYAKTGELPSGTSPDALEDRKRIVNRAAELFPNAKFKSRR